MPACQPDCNPLCALLTLFFAAVSCEQIHTSKMSSNSFLGRDVDLAELAGKILAVIKLHRLIGLCNDE